MISPNTRGVGGHHLSILISPQVIFKLVLGGDGFQLIDA